MSRFVQGSDVRELVFGRRASKSTGTLAASTVALFTVAGGRVALTTVYGLVGTAITVANSYKLQHNPTAGTTVDLFAATDIGTTDTAAGELLSFGGGDAGSFLSVGGAVESLRAPLVLAAGQVESVSAGTDGEITWVVTWVPLDDGASLVAA
jgi:hypothetical protein